MKKTKRLIALMLSTTIMCLTLMNPLAVRADDDWDSDYGEVSGYDGEDGSSDSSDSSDNGWDGYIDNEVWDHPQDDAPGVNYTDDTQSDAVNAQGSDGAGSAYLLVVPQENNDENAPKALKKTPKVVKIDSTENAQEAADGLPYFDEDVGDSWADMSDEEKEKIEDAIANKRLLDEIDKYHEGVDPDIDGDIGDSWEDMSYEEREEAEKQLAIAQLKVDYLNLIKSEFDNFVRNGKTDGMSEASYGLRYTLYLERINRMEKGDFSGEEDYLKQEKEISETGYNYEYEQERKRAMEEAWASGDTERIAKLSYYQQIEDIFLATYGFLTLTEDDPNYDDYLIMRERLERMKEGDYSDEPEWQDIKEALEQKDRIIELAARLGIPPEKASEDGFSKLLDLVDKIDVFQKAKNGIDKLNMGKDEAALVKDLIDSGAAVLQIPGYSTYNDIKGIKRLIDNYRNGKVKSGDTVKLCFHILDKMFDSATSMVPIVGPMAQFAKNAIKNVGNYIFKKTGLSKVVDKGCEKIEEGVRWIWRNTLGRLFSDSGVKTKKLQKCLLPTASYMLS